MVGGAWVVRNGEHETVNIQDVEREIWERLQFALGGPSMRLDTYLRKFYRGWDKGEWPRLPR